MQTKFLFSVILMLCVPGLTTAGTISDSLEKGNSDVVSTSSKSVDIYSVPLSAVEYRQATKAGQREGYLVPDQKKVTGAIRRTAFDFYSNATAHSVYTMMVKKLSAAGYAVEFFCNSNACGDAQGWSLYFPTQIDVDTSRQYYGAARFPKTGPAERYLTFHVGAIADRPRLAVDEVDILNEHTAAIRGYARGLETYLQEYNDTSSLSLLQFDTDSDKLSERGRLILKALDIVMENNPQWGINLIGYADTIGDESYNEALSERRAGAVATYLKRLGVSEQRIKERGAGSDVATKEATAASLQKSRRVDIERRSRQEHAVATH